MMNKINDSEKQEINKRRKAKLKQVRKQQLVNNNCSSLTPTTTHYSYY